MGVKRSQSLFVAAAVVALSLVGCTSGDSAETKPTTATQETTTEAPAKTPKPQSTPKPTQKPENKPITFPACEELVTQEEVTAHVGGGFVLIPGQSTEDGLLQSALGPSAKAALDQATQSSYCVWAIPQSDGSTVILSAELPDKARDTFLAELRASDFTETEVNGSPTFVWETDQHYGPRFVWYGFSGNILVTSLALGPNGDIGNIALSRLKQANPAA